jgi:hypothetical protein
MPVTRARFIATTLLAASVPIGLELMQELGAPLLLVDLADRTCPGA